MEFPNLGAHCFESTCKQLDFLPTTCDECHNIFCVDHIMYTKHNCPTAYKKDVQVPVCPLCNKPIPVKRGQSPDIPVSQHIDTDCQSDPAKANRRKIYSNKCFVKGCKQKELVPVRCDSCKQNFCLKHRLELDHKCEGPRNPASSAGAAAMARFHNKQGNKGSSKSSGLKTNTAKTTSNKGNAMNIQPRMTDDEALNMAMRLSMQDSRSSQPDQEGTHASTNQEEEDRNLAKAIAESEREFHRRQNRRNTDKSSSSCTIT